MPFSCRNHHFSTALTSQKGYSILDSTLILCRRGRRLCSKFRDNYRPIGNPWLLNSLLNSLIFAFIPTIAQCEQRKEYEENQ